MEPLSVPSLEAFLTLELRVAELERQLKAREDPSPYLSIPEAAAYLRCRRQRIYELLSMGTLTRFKDGRRTLICREQLRKYVQRREGVMPLR